MKTIVDDKPPGTRPAANAAGDVINILLVDDENRNLDVLESILESPGLRFTRTTTPEDALLALVHEEFACIILDIHMPSMSGLDLARLIKTRRRNQNTPIIFLTAYFLEEKDILQGYGAGAVDYLTKPINQQILKSKVGVFVDLFRTARALAAANVALEAEIGRREKVEEELRTANNELGSRVEERTAELSLKERLYRQVVSSLPAAVYTTDEQGRVTLYNDAAAILWGRHPEIGKELWSGSHKMFLPDGTDLPLDQCPMARTLQAGRGVRGEEIILERPDGTRRNILPYPEPIRDFSGKIIGAVNMLVDITERKQSEAAARHLAAIVESSDDAIVGKDINGVVTSWNIGAQRLFGYSAAEMIGQPVAILIPSDRLDEGPQILGRIRHGESVEHYETVRRRKDGDLIDVSLTVSPIKDAGGKIVGASKIARDVTQHKRAEAELKRAHEEALLASRAKDDFLATLSHELRTPLNPVLLIASEGANNRELPPRVRTDFATISKNVELEAHIIDDLLDLTRITRGKVILDKKLLDARDVLEDALANVHEEMHQKQIDLELKLAAARHTLFADAVRLQQIFLNLLKNAVKFTPPGGRITVASAVENDRLLVNITDTGIGMLPEEIAGAFNAFSQGNHADSGHGRQFGGLGLGLAISQKLAEFHSARITARSEGRDRGSQFIIELPLAQSPEMKSGPSPAPVNPPALEFTPPKNRTQILLVEDHGPTRTTLTHLLMRRNFIVLTAATLAEARALAEAGNFNLLISDIGLPDGTGYELLEELKERRVDLKAIALTGYGMEHDIARSQLAGFELHLTKPVRVESLDRALALILDRTRGAE